MTAELGLTKNFRAPRTSGPLKNAIAHGHLRSTSAPEASSTLDRRDRKLMPSKLTFIAPGSPTKASTLNSSIDPICT